MELELVNPDGANLLELAGLSDERINEISDFCESLAKTTYENLLNKQKVSQSERYLEIVRFANTPLEISIITSFAKDCFNDYGINL